MRSKVRTWSLRRTAAQYYWSADWMASDEEGCCATAGTGTARHQLVNRKKARRFTGRTDQSSHTLLRLAKGRLMRSLCCSTKAITR